MSTILPTFNTGDHRAVHSAHRKLGKLIPNFFAERAKKIKYEKNRACHSHFNSHASIGCACQKAIKDQRKMRAVKWRRCECRVEFVGHNFFFHIFSHSENRDLKN